MRKNNFIWNAIGTSLNSFLSLFLLIIVTRINGIENSGLFSFLYALTLIIQMFSNYGGRIYQVSDINKEFTFQEYFGSRMITSVASVVLSIFLIILLNLNQSSIVIFILLLLFRVIETFSDIFYASFQKNNRLDIVGKSLTLKSVFVFIMFLILNIIYKKLYIASISMLIASLLVLIFYDFIKVSKFEKIHFSINLNIFKKSFNIFIFGFITLMILNSPRIVGNYTLLENQMGFLGILMMIPTIMALFSQFIIQPQIITLTNIIKNNKISELNKVIKKIIFFIIIISLLCSIVAITIGPFVLQILYGLNFEKFRWYFVLLIFAGTFNGITTLLSNVLTIYRITLDQVIAYLFVLLINLLLSYAMSLNNSLNGMFIALTITMFLQTIYFLLLYMKNVKLYIKNMKS